MSPRPGGDVSNSSEFAVMGSGEYRAPAGDNTARAVAVRFVREHTAQSLFLIYFAVTVVSRLDDVWFYQRFRVNILNYGDPQDFLLAAMRYPVIWIYFAAATGIVLLFSWLADTRKSPRRAPTKLNNPRIRLITGSLLVVLMAAVITKMHADKRADVARAGVGRHVAFTRNDGVTYPEQPLLLGSTRQFFFLYYPKRRVAEIVPVENTALMTVDLHPKNDPGTAIPSVGGTGNSPRLSP